MIAHQILVFKNFVCETQRRDFANVVTVISLVRNFSEDGIFKID
jgi:hypothetical protein